jgi:putative sterol carrier protein
VANGATSARPGRAARIDVELRCRFADWVDVVAGRLDPARALATGRLRPRGKPRALWAARSLF